MNWYLHGIPLSPWPILLGPQIHLQPIRWQSLFTEADSCGQLYLKHSQEANTESHLPTVMSVITWHVPGTVAHSRCAQVVKAAGEPLGIKDTLPTHPPPRRHSWVLHYYRGVQLAGHCVMCLSICIGYMIGSGIVES